MKNNQKPEPRLSVSHSITSTGKLEIHENGMPRPKTQRIAPGFNAWVRLIDMLNYYKR